MSWQPQLYDWSRRRRRGRRIGRSCFTGWLAGRRPVASARQRRLACRRRRYLVLEERKLNPILLVLRPLKTLASCRRRSSSSSNSLKSIGLAAHVAATATLGACLPASSSAGSAAARWPVKAPRQVQEASEEEEEEKLCSCRSSVVGCRSSVVGRRLALANSVASPNPCCCLTFGSALFGLGAQRERESGQLGGRRVVGPFSLQPSARPSEQPSPEISLPVSCVLLSSCGLASPSSLLPKSLGQRVGQPSRPSRRARISQSRRKWHIMAR